MGVQELAALVAEMLLDWEMGLQLYVWLGSLKKIKRDYAAVCHAKNTSSNSDTKKAVIMCGSIRKLARERKRCVFQVTQGRALEWSRASARSRKATNWLPEALDGVQS